MIVKHMGDSTMTFLELIEKFDTEEKAILYFIEQRYQGKKICPHCGSDDKVYHRKDHIKLFQCNSCNNQFSVFKNTIFEKSDTDFRKWLYAINLFLNGKKGISGYQLQRQIGVTYKTAWRMLKQIRIAMGNHEDKEFINTIIEMDEAYIGGKPRKGNNRTKSKDDNDDTPKPKPTPNKRGRGTKKTPVIGVTDRLNKQIHAKVAFPNEDGKSLTGKQLLNVLEEVVKGKSIVVTDEYTGYNFLRKSDHVHFTINHNEMYVDGIIHTNTIESFWANLKRGITGIYHKVSAKYLQNYVNEFCFRWNNRGSNTFNLVLRQAVLV